MGNEPAKRGERVERAGLWVLLAFTLVAVVGFGLFGMRPERLAWLPPSLATFYGTAFELFAQGQVWLAALVLAVPLYRRARFDWLPALAVLYGLSLGSELLGTGSGIPFGEYAYSELLGGRWGGRVPYVIPLSWFLMSVPSYGLARVAYPERALPRIALASVILLSWDLALDPAMSHATRYWVWGESGPYYGMPWLNLVGWYVTGVVLMTALVLLRADRWVARIPTGWLTKYYGLNPLMPLGMCAVAGLVGAVAATLAALAVSSTWILMRVGRPRAVLAGGA